MTETAASSVDQVHAFRAALTPTARAALHMSQTVHATIAAAIRDHGWTPAQLAAECSRDLADVANAGAVVTHRLRHAAGNPPGRPARAAKHSPLCGECEQGWLLDPLTRLPASRCPCRTGDPP